MSNLAIPFNIFLLPVDSKTLSGCLPVTTLDIFDGMSKNFHDQGLYSTTIFGKVGDVRRKRRFGYIDIKLRVFHPIIYKALVALRAMYADIMAGKQYVIWDDEINDFVKSNAAEGYTGFSYFVEHWKKIEFEKRPSDIRAENIKLIEKYRNDEDSATPNRIVVVPAGVRDFQIQGDGRYSEEEVNTFYKKILSQSSSIPAEIKPEDMALYNGTRMVLQRNFNAIYDLYESMVKGKKKLILGKWASRKVYNGVRNVITSMPISTEEFHAKGNVSFNDTIVGVYQFLKGCLPVCKYQIRNGFLSKVFVGPNAPAMLVNKETLRSEFVQISPELYDKWMTDEGIEGMINQYAEKSLRHKELEVSNHYVALIYKGDGVFKLFQDIDHLPEGYDPALVSPVTFAELIYCSIYKVANEYPTFVTRYPITSPLSSYPSMTYLMTTTQSERRVELDDNWQPTEYTAFSFPIKGMPFMEAMSPHPAHLAGLNADFDGDTGSGTMGYSEDTKNEIRDLLRSRRYYVGTNGQMNFSIATDTVKYLLHNLTGKPE